MTLSIVLTSKNESNNSTIKDIINADPNFSAYGGEWESETVWSAGRLSYCQCMILREELEHALSCLFFDIVVEEREGPRL